MRWRIEWTNGAVSDLRAISDHIERDRNMATANRVARTIHNTARSLSHMPYRGRFGPMPGLRELVVPQLPYIVTYRISEGRVIILGIAHDAQERP